MLMQTKMKVLLHCS